MSYDSPIMYIQRLRDEGHPIRIAPHQLTEGEYDGEWTGYNVLVRIGEFEYTMTTAVGLKSPSACIVKINNGKATVLTGKSDINYGPSNPLPDELEPFPIKELEDTYGEPSEPSQSDTWVKKSEE